MRQGALSHSYRYHHRDGVGIQNGDGSDVISQRAESTIPPVGTRGGCKLDEESAARIGAGIATEVDRPDKNSYYIDIPIAIDSNPRTIIHVEAAQSGRPAMTSIGCVTSYPHVLGAH